MSCIELSKIIGEFLRREILKGYMLEAEEKGVKLVFSDTSVMKELGLAKESIHFHCTPGRFYLSTLPIFFDETFEETIDVASKIAGFLTKHDVGVFTIIYEKYHSKNKIVIKILTNLEKKLKMQDFTFFEKIQIAILIYDLLETSKRIKEIKRGFKGENDYIRYQVEMEKISKLLKRIKERISSEALNKILSHDIEGLRNEEEVDGAEIIRKVISENVGSNHWVEKSLIVTPSESLGSIDDNVVSLMDSLLTKFLHQGVEIFFYVPSKFFFLPNLITKKDRVILI